MNITALASGMGAAIKADLPAVHIPSGPLIHPTPPAFVVYDFNITPHASMGFMSEADVIARIVVSRADAHQSAVDTELLLSDGVGSIFYSLMKPVILGTAASQTFGGACASASVKQLRGYRQFQYGTNFFVGAEIVVHVIGERTP